MTRVQQSRGALCTLALVSLVILGACQKKPPVEIKPDATPVRVARATTGPDRPPVETTGVVAARDELRLSFKVGGIVQQISVREGDAVKRGQVLARLDPTEIAAQSMQAHQAMEKAERDLKRGEALQADQVIPLETLQNLRTQAEMARAQWRAASFNEQNAVITAPGDGVILRRLVEEREVAAPGQVVLAMGRRDSGFVVRFAVADRQIVQLRKGDAVSVHLDALPGEALAASVAQIASAADPASGLFEVEARLASSSAALVTGMVGRVRLTPLTATRELVHVPISAVLEGHGEDATVFVTDGKVAHRRQVKVAFITADSVALQSGLAAGEQVITAGAPYVEDGETIAIAP